MTFAEQAEAVKICKELDAALPGSRDAYVIEWLIAQLATARLRIVELEQFRQEILKEQKTTEVYT